MKKLNLTANTYLHPNENITLEDIIADNVELKISATVSSSEFYLIAKFFEKLINKNQNKKNENKRRKNK